MPPSKKLATRSPTSSPVLMNPQVRTSSPSSQSAEIVSALRADGTLDPAHDPGLSDQEVEYLYRQMVTTRQLDDRLVMLQRQGRIGFHVGSLGEEAAILGSAFTMARQDFLFPCY